MAKRVFLIVLDSVGIGEEPDAAAYGDEGSNTLRACWKSGKLDIPNLRSLGIFNIEGVGCGEPVEAPKGAYGRMREASAGKDTTIGHWEIAGIVSERPLPTYPEGFPAEILQEFQRRTDRKVLCNKPYSGTRVIQEYGREHVETGALIVYTSADSVFQIAAHESVVPVELLYEYCKTARSILTGRHGVGRVIARPFTGTYPDYTRTTGRHDFSISPPRPSVLNRLQEQGFKTIGIGKINDIFAGSGITQTIHTNGNEEGMDETAACLKKTFSGLCFVNLVDFDMLYGHRNDILGYTAALNAFDRRLGELLPMIGEEDVLMITADHGCDPSTVSTDHSREYVPFLVYGKTIRPGVNLGTCPTFADIGETAAALLGVQAGCDGRSLAESILYSFSEIDMGLLAKEAFFARRSAYAPYSGFQVGAALLDANGRIWHGCNIENASFSVCNCAERTALFKAVSEGVREFQAIAIAGGMQDDKNDEFCFPCGVCRQALLEFCPPEFPVIVAKSETEYEQHALSELLPYGFSGRNLSKRGR